MADQDLSALIAPPPDRSAPNGSLSVVCHFYSQASVLHTHLIVTSIMSLRATSTAGYLLQNQCQVRNLLTLTGTTAAQCHESVSYGVCIPPGIAKGNSPMKL